MTPPTVTDFRQLFPSFSDRDAYADIQVQAQLGVATELVNEARWGNNYAYGIGLVTAHFLALDGQAAKNAAAGGMPGQAIGLLSSKSAQGVSASYNFQTLNSDAGFWGLTTFGQRYWYLMNLYGAGPVHLIGPTPSDFYGYGAQDAWPGPAIYPPY